jgi:hypothetical protein
MNFINVPHSNFGAFTIALKASKNAPAKAEMSIMEFQNGIRARPWILKNASRSLAVPKEKGHQCYP